MSRISNSNVSWSFSSSNTNTADLWKNIETSPDEFVQLNNSNSKRWNFAPNHNDLPNASVSSKLSGNNTKSSPAQKFAAPSNVPAATNAGKFAHNALNIEEEITGQNLYKTELCRSFEETGTCRYGSKCQFAHGRAELRPVLRHPKYKTEVCKTFHTIGTCPYGKRCRFIHTTAELPSSTSPVPTQPSSTDLNTAELESEVIGDSDHCITSNLISSMKLSPSVSPSPQKEHQSVAAFSQVMPSFSNTGVTDVNLAHVLKSNTADWSTSWNTSNLVPFNAPQNNGSSALFSGKTIVKPIQKPTEVATVVDNNQSEIDNENEERRLAIFRKICHC